MNFEDIIGQREMAERLRNLADNNRLPHAIMLCGPQGSGKMALAIALASHLLGTNEQAWSMLNIFQHPDLHFAFPIIRPKGASADKKFDFSLRRIGIARLHQFHQPLAYPFYDFHLLSAGIFF